MRRDERAMVTAETAMVMPFLVLVAVAMAWMVSLGVTQVRLADAAREAVRVVARGESASIAREGAQAAVPGSKVRIVTENGRARALVSRRSRLPLVPRLHIDLRATAVTVVE